MTRTGFMVGATVAMVAAAIAIGIATGELAGWGFPGSQGMWAIGYVVAGAIIVRSRSDHPVGRFLMWAGLVSALVQVAGQLGTSYALPLFFVAANTFGWMVTDVLLLAGLGRFPDGEWINASARWFVGIGLAVTVWAALVGLTGPVNPAIGVASPWGLAFWADLPSWLVTAPYFAFQANLAVASFVLLVALFRRGPVVRRQIGWVLLAFLVMGVVGGLAAAIDGPTDGGVLSLASALTTVLLPISLVVAVTKYRLYEIDRIASRTVAYGLTVVVMAAVYGVAVLGLGLLVPVEADWQVAVATLAAVAVSVPAARRARRWVDLRFFRSRYDANRVVGAFATEIQEEIDLARLVERTESTVGSTFEPESVTVWVGD